MKPQRQIDRVGKQILADSSGEPLADGLNIERLDPLKSQAHQNRSQQHQDDQSDRNRAVETLKERNHRFVGGPADTPQNSNRLPDQQRLNRAGKSNRNEQHQRERESSSVSAQVTAKPLDPLKIRTSHQLATLDAGVVDRIASTIWRRSP